MTCLEEALALLQHVLLEALQREESPELSAKFQRLHERASARLEHDRSLQDLSKEVDDLQGREDAARQLEATIGQEIDRTLQVTTPLALRRLLPAILMTAALVSLGLAMVLPLLGGVPTLIRLPIGIFSLVFGFLFLVGVPAPFIRYAWWLPRRNELRERLEGLLSRQRELSAERDQLHSLLEERHPRMRGLVEVAVNTVVDEERTDCYEMTVPDSISTEHLAEHAEIPYPVATDALERALPFLERQQCTIGISGERGAGKTTLMRMLEAETLRRRDSLTAWIHAPTTSQEKEFLASLLELVAVRAIQELRLPAGRLLDPLEERSRLWWVAQGFRQAALWLLTAGTLLITLAIAHPLVDVLAPESNAKDAFVQLSAPEILAIVSGFVFVAAILFGSHRRLATERPPVDPLSARTEDLLRRLWYEISESMSAEVSGELPGLRLATGGSREYTRIPFSVPGLVTAFQDYVAGLIGQVPRTGVSEPRIDTIKKVVIFLDELDKIGEFQNVDLVLRYLKVLFGRNTCFFVTISEDARDRFVRRTVGERDVFESSFDDVIGVQRLAYRDVRELVAGRVTGKLCVPLFLLVYAVSKGNPRDAIRVARDALEQNVGQDIDRLARELVCAHQLAPLTEVYAKHFDDVLATPSGTRKRKIVREVIAELEHLKHEFARDYTDWPAFFRAIYARLIVVHNLVSRADSGGYGVAIAVAAMVTAVECFVHADEQSFKTWQEAGGGPFGLAVLASELAHSNQERAANLVDEIRQTVKLPLIWGNYTRVAPIQVQPAEAA